MLFFTETMRCKPSFNSVQVSEHILVYQSGSSFRGLSMSGFKPDLFISTYFWQKKWVRFTLVFSFPFLSFSDVITPSLGKKAPLRLFTEPIYWQVIKRQPDHSKPWFLLFFEIQQIQIPSIVLSPQGKHCYPLLILCLHEAHVQHVQRCRSCI